MLVNTVRLPNLPMMGIPMKTLAAAVLMAMSSVALAGPNLVMNGDFESGALAWQQGAYMTIDLVATTNRGKSAATGCIGPECVDLPNVSSLNQTIHTTIGVSYELSFFVAEYLGSPSEFAVYWGGNLLERVMNPANDSLNYLGDGMFEGTWTQFTYTGLLATSAGTEIELRGRHDPGAMYFDDISVVDNTGTDVPEPGSMALLGIGVLALAGRRIRR